MVGIEYYDFTIEQKCVRLQFTQLIRDVWISERSVDSIAGYQRCFLGVLIGKHADAIVFFLEYPVFLRERLVDESCQHRRDAKWDFAHIRVRVWFASNLLQMSFDHSR